MPYTHKKVGNEYVVYKHGKKVGSTKGTKVALDKYLAALHIADKKTVDNNATNASTNGASSAKLRTPWL